MRDLQEVIARAIDDNSGDIYWNCEAGRHPNIYMDTAQAALSAITAAGYAVVPVEPSEEVVRDICEAIEIAVPVILGPGEPIPFTYCQWESEARASYKAMIAAAQATTNPTVGE